MNRQEKKQLKQIIKSIDNEYLEDIAEFPQIVQSFYTDVGAEPPSIEDIRLYLNEEISRRLKRIIIKEVFTSIIPKK